MSLSKKLNQKEAAILQNILSDLKTAEKYIQRTDIELCRLNKMPYGTSYINKEGQGVDIINKHIGSDLCYLYNAIRKLENILQPANI